MRIEITERECESLIKILERTKGKEARKLQEKLNAVMKVKQRLENLIDEIE